MILASSESDRFDRARFIDYRRLSMNERLSRETAELYAGWFRALADPTRIQILAWLALQPQPVSVGELTAVMPVGQSTVSHHLAALASVGFLKVAHQGTRSLYSVNPACLECFPSAADVVMGKRPPEHGVSGSDATRIVG